jgi:hypothetical protein
VLLLDEGREEEVVEDLLGEGWIERIMVYKDSIIPTIGQSGHSSTWDIISNNLSTVVLVVILIERLGVINREDEGRCVL